MFFYAAIRLLPAISKIVQSIQSIKYNYAVIDIIYKELSSLEKINFPGGENRVQDFNEKKELIFDNFDFENVNFSYPNSYEKNLKDININIKKGDKVGVTGKTGSGKSTFINLFCGLFYPTEGRIKINGNDLIKIEQSWQKNIGYVPQTVSIIDESILFNITLEDKIEKVDLDRVNELLKQIDYTTIFINYQTIFMN